MSLPVPNTLRCKYCRHQVISRSEDFITHDPAKMVPEAFRQKDGPKIINQKCTLYFVEEQQWVLEGIEDPELEKEGPINCPKCKHKIGGWSWMGIQCSCGTWVNPGFSFIKSKVDPIFSQPPPVIRRPPPQAPSTTSASAHDQQLDKTA